MDIAGFLESYVFGPPGFWTMAPLHYAAKFVPFLSLDCAPTPSTLVQSKERKGSNFVIWQPCAQALLLNPTKRNQVKEESWKHTWLILFPIMLLITTPRLASASLLLSYAKEYTFIFLALFVFAGLLINLYPYALRDPAQAFFGIMSNLYSPCVVIEEGSKFLAKSSIAATILHCLNLVVLLSLVLSESGFTPKKDENPPLIHCFGNNSATNST